MSERSEKSFVNGGFGVERWAAYNVVRPWFLNFMATAISCGCVIMSCSKFKVLICTALSGWHTCTCKRMQNDIIG